MDELVVPTRRGRSPDMVLGQDVVDGYGKANSLKATQSDVDALGRGCPAQAAEDAYGNERRDYQIPLKNADGTLTRKAYEMIEMHQPSIRQESVMAEVLQSKIVKEAVVRPDGTIVQIMSANAKAEADRLGFKPLVNWGRWSERTIYRSDGSKVVLRRAAGGLITSEWVPA